MTDATIAAPPAGFRGPRLRTRIEAREDSPFAGFWIEVDSNALTNGVVLTLRRTPQWHDLVETMAPLILGWNYVGETVEAVEAPAVLDGEREVQPARTVYRVTGEEPIPPPAQIGREALDRVFRIELDRGRKPDDGTLGWIHRRLAGFADELPDDVRKALARLANGPGGERSETAPSPTATPPSPPSSPSASPPSRPRSRGRSTSG